MVLMLAERLREEFAVRAEAAAYERFRRQELDERDRRERKRDEVENHADDAMDVAVAFVAVSEAEIGEFRAELDAYDPATVEALQINDINFDRARERLDAIFARAHVLPDGRRVFKTEDGLRVFDEFGRELEAEEIEPDEIADERPRWEEAKESIDDVKALERERADLLAYQQKLDEARERLDAGDLSRDEFERLREQLKTDMPPAVRELLPEAAKPKVEAAAAPAPQVKLDIDDDMVPTVGASKLPMPGMSG